MKSRYNAFGFVLVAALIIGAGLYLLLGPTLDSYQTGPLVPVTRDGSETN